jgi:hypothetical protein
VIPWPLLIVAFAAGVLAAVLIRDMTAKGE